MQYFINIRYLLPFYTAPLLSQFKRSAKSIPFFTNGKVLLQESSMGLGNCSKNGISQQNFKNQKQQSHKCKNVKFFAVPFYRRHFNFRFF